MLIGSTFLELNNNKLWCIVSDEIIYFLEYNSFVKRFNFTTTVVAKRMKYHLKTKSKILKFSKEKMFMIFFEEGIKSVNNCTRINEVQ